MALRRFAGLSGLLSLTCTTPVDVGLGEPTNASSSTSDAPTTASDESASTEHTGEPTSTADATTASTSGDTSTSAADTTLVVTDATTPSTGSPPECGDGIVGPSESCDLGYAENSDQGACTLSCEHATCGDGLIWAGHEHCDHGPNNNDAAYNGCTTQCVAGPRCNDGVVQEPEECDEGDANGSGFTPENGVPCDVGCKFVARMAFVSSVAYTGGQLGGVEGAHLRCQLLAGLAGLDNATHFKAILSDADWSPLIGFSGGELPLVRRDGVRVADRWSDLLELGPENGVVADEFGEIWLYERVWTGTAPGGDLFDQAQTCASWTSSSPVDKGRGGRTGVDPTDPQEWMQWKTQKQWLSEATSGCHYKRRIYCVEQ